MLTEKLTKKVWTQLQDGQVPIVSSTDLSNVREIVKNINQNIRSNSYVPDIGHGYLGLQKGAGVTRFLPILSKEDMAVYYHICGNLGETILKNQEGIFGGWRSIPASQKSRDMLTNEKSETDSKAFHQGYLSDTFSNYLWFEEFKNYTQLINKLTRDTSLGNFVIATDVANFYDSIEIPHLVHKLRNASPNKQQEIELLEMFLGFWNRRTTGYQMSSKGIPQEIISDGSRFLSHFYLQDFDKKFLDYCNTRSLKYIRWADDFLVFGPSPKSLEAAVHQASRLLLPEGLNLNAPKTRIFTRTEFAKYRAINILDAINLRDKNIFRKHLRSAINRQSKEHDLRIDTVFRVAIGFAYGLGKKVQTFEKNFIFETAYKNPDLVGTLNEEQLQRLISISDDPKKMFLQIRSICINKPFAGPRTNFLRLIRLKSSKLVSLGVSISLQNSSIDLIVKNSTDSEIITNFCAPATSRAITPI